MSSWKYFNHTVKGEKSVSVAEAVGCCYDFVPAFVSEFGRLPIECRACYKGLVFFGEPGSRGFRKVVDNLPVPVSGKYNDGVAVFYFRDKDKMMSLLSVLDSAIRAGQLHGHTSWRVAGKYCQDKYPQFFRSAKELVPVDETVEPVGVKQWLDGLLLKLGVRQEVGYNPLRKLGGSICVFVEDSYHLLGVIFRKWYSTSSSYRSLCISYFPMFKTFGITRKRQKLSMSGVSL